MGPMAPMGPVGSIGPTGSMGPIGLYWLYDRVIGSVIDHFGARANVA